MNFFRRPAGRHDLDVAELSKLDWRIVAAIRDRQKQAAGRRLVEGRHRPVRVNARLRRARLRAERGAT